MSKAKIGLSQFQYATVENEKTKSEIFKIPGMRSAKLDITNELETIYADDGPYLVIPAGITELKLELGLVDLPTIDKQQMLGVTVESGIERYTKTIKVPDVAVMFRALMDDNKYCYVGLAKGKFNLPGMDLKTKEDKIEVAEDSITGNFVARGEEEDMLFIGREDNEDFKLDVFTKMVFNGQAPTPPVGG
ncbi:major tail protein [Latilactobacillus sakei]|uniref:major tail protein n=1 Tax=Latilactobacillus sakei TaxID=1599 RepID=UPI000C6F145C|nr:major tail protein [Latilactobacillus sakei]SON66851.1 putative phage major tail protein [Latilactobacillus sakei]